ncbi:MAG: autotransporter-associated beta strand repeat-containing protein [Verrucomicrobiota bacterium]|jgi:autotransporter-associated beta strand protein
MVAVCAALLSNPIHAATWSWSGGGANAYWNNSVNWGFAGIPANGDTVIFPASQPNLLNTNNIAGLTLNQIRFVGAGGGYDIRGNAFTLTNSIMATNTAGANIIENSITLATANVLMVVSNGVSLTLDGTLSGSVGVNKAGLGTLTYQGPVSNPYTGTTLVSGGTLQLNVGGVSAFEGPLVIGDGTGTGSPMVQDLQSVELENTGPITINLNGTLNLNNFSENYNINPSLTLSGGTIETGTGTLTLSANSTITSTNGYDSFIYGNLNTGTGTLTLQGGGGLYLYATVSGSANIVQKDVDTLWISANTYTGNYTANGSGYVYLLTSLALGNTNNAMTLNGQALVLITGNINITNQSLTINSTYPYGALYVYGPSTNSWQANFTLGSACTINVFTNCALNLNGPISGSGGFTTIGPGLLTLSGSSANSYAGLTTVNEGELDLNKTAYVLAIPSFGPGLVIGDGTGTDTVRSLNNGQIWSIVTPVTINSSGVLNVNGYVDEAAPLTLNGGQITTGSAGQFRLFGTVTVLPAGATISGNVLLSDGVVITNYLGASLYIPASISGSYGITEVGAGNLYLSASNSYTGLTVVQQGWLWAENSWALGSTSSGIIVSNGASLVLAGNIGITNKTLTLNGPGEPTYGALDVESGASTWAGPIIVNTTSTLDSYYAGSSLHIAGPISGAGGLELFGSGSHYFEGSTANTYAGTTTVDGSTTLVLNNSADEAVPGNLDIFGTVRLAQSFQTVNAADVKVESGGLFDFSTYYSYLNTLHGLGTVNFGVGGWIYVGLNNGSSEFDGTFTGTGYASGWTVGKTGSGTFTIGGNSTYTAGITHVLAGKVVINGSQPLIPVTVDAGATLGGSGTVGPITANGIISPGNSVGILNSSNVTFSSLGNFTAELTGPNPGVGGYDQLNVTGTASLASATLTVIPNFTTPVSIGQQFTIINNDLADAITGTFNGLANGAQFSTGGYTFRINYAGGTGNDVVLTLWGVTNKTVTLNAVDSGWYDNTGYHVPLNQNYLVGRLGANTYNNWFVFNVPVFSGSIIHAELLINCYTNVSPYGQETYLLRQVTNSISALEAGGSGLTNIYNDLGDGGIYGIRNVFVVESGQTAIIPLDVQFFNDATAASGSQIALGGSIPNLDPTNNQYLFGNSYGNPADVQLRLTFGTNLVITSANRGWYDESGNHTANNLNYTVGYDSDLADLYRDFFVFNLPALSSQLVDAELLVNSYTNVSPSGVDTYQLYDVTTSITVLTNNASGATNIYADLGSGVVYGGRNVYVSESGMIASIPLNGSFLGAALANSGGRIALGGALTSLNPVPDEEYLFGFSSSSVASDVQLWLGFLNAPSSHPSFVGGTPTYLGNNQFQLTVSGTTGTANEIQGSFDFQNWDFIGDLVMTNSTSSLLYINNTVVPYRFFRAEQLQ